MLRIFLILIGLLVSNYTLAAECGEGPVLTVTSPRDGTKTYREGISVRGFLCENYPVVVVKNKTTDKTIVTDTKESCHENQCFYTFATFIRDLTLGSNELSASIPGREDTEISVEVTRTALAANDYLR